MKKTTLLFFLIFIFSVSSFSQELMRSTTSVIGKSSSININSNTYIIQQSIGQSSINGLFQSNNLTVLQGFLQPPLISSKVILEETDLNALVYPNPFNSNVNIKFNESIDDTIQIQIFDMLGRSVYNSNYKPNQELTLDLSFLSSSEYILTIKTGFKQFKSNLIKQ